jgi:hypothetical protein
MRLAITILALVASVIAAPVAAPVAEAEPQSKYGTYGMLSTHLPNLGQSIVNLY